MRFNIQRGRHFTVNELSTSVINLNFKFLSAFSLFSVSRILNTASPWPRVTPDDLATGIASPLSAPVFLPRIPRQSASPETILGQYDVSMSRSPVRLPVQAISLHED